MGYTIKVDTDNLNPLSEMGNRELTTWRGLKNKTLRGRHVTDGGILIDKKHVENEELFDKLTKRRSDEVIENDEIKSLVDQLKNEEQWVANVRGQMTSPSGMQVKPKWVALVGYRNYKNHVFVDGQHIQMIEKLMGESPDMKMGRSNILTWWKYGVPVASAAGWNSYKPKIQ